MRSNDETAAAGRPRFRITTAPIDVVPEPYGTADGDLASSAAAAFSSRRGVDGYQPHETPFGSTCQATKSSAHGGAAPCDKAAAIVDFPVPDAAQNATTRPLTTIPLAWRTSRSRCSKATGVTPRRNASSRAAAVAPSSGTTITDGSRGVILNVPTRGHCIHQVCPSE